MRMRWRKKEREKKETYFSASAGTSEMRGKNDVPGAIVDNEESACG
jgi:hypothetical protein